MGAVRIKQSTVRYKGLPAGLLPGRPAAALGGGRQNWFGSGFAYSGAVPSSQEMMAWLPIIRSPDSEINRDRDILVARTRDLVRNDGWAKGAINRITDAAVGAQFFPVPRPIWRALSRHLGPKFDDVWAREFTSIAVSEWRLWADDPARHCDAAKRLTVTQMLRQLFRTKMIEGDGLCFLPWNPDAKGPGAARYATCVQLVDPDRLSNPMSMIDTQFCRGGVQIDGLSAAVGYHLRRAHPYDTYLSADSLIWDYFPRWGPLGRPFVVHDFDADRADQHRGIGVLTEIIARFRMLNTYDATSVQKAILRNVLGFFISSTRTEDEVGDSLDPAGSARGYVERAIANDELRGELNNNAPITMGGVRVPVLPPGEKVNVVGASGEADDFATFESAVIRSISSATGQSSEEISNDFSKLNYSSFRGSLLQAWKTLIRRRRDFQAGTATPIYSAFLEEMVDMTPEAMPRGFTSMDFAEHRSAFAYAQWIGPGRGWVDPVKERQGEVLGLDAGFGTLEQTCADISGMWWEDVLDQRKHEMDTMTAYGMHQPDWAGGNMIPAQLDDRKPEPV